MICPGFVADCLETLEEIALEGKAEFLGAGGKGIPLHPALSRHPLWIDALAGLVERHLQGWPTRTAPPADQLAESARRAKELGARAKSAAAPCISALSDKRSCHGIESPRRLPPTASRSIACPGNASPKASCRRCRGRFRSAAPST